jgi:hypothetical protein
VTVIDEPVDAAVVGVQEDMRQMTSTPAKVILDLSAVIHRF